MTEEIYRQVRTIGSKRKTSAKLAISYALLLLPLIYFVGLQMRDMASHIDGLERTQTALTLAGELFASITPETVEAPQINSTAAAMKSVSVPVQFSTLELPALNQITEQHQHMSRLLLFDIPECKVAVLLASRLVDQLSESIPYAQEYFVLNDLVNQCSPMRNSMNSFRSQTFFHALDAEFELQQIMAVFERYESKSQLLNEGLRRRALLGEILGKTSPFPALEIRSLQLEQAFLLTLLDDTYRHLIKKIDRGLTDRIKQQDEQRFFQLLILVLAAVSAIAVGYYILRSFFLTQRYLAYENQYLETIIQARVRDISAARRKAERLNQELAIEIERSKQLTKEAQLANEAKSAFLAAMSHEIRTPLNGILGVAQLLDNTRLTRVQHGYLETMTSAGHALLTILSSVLDYSKIESGKMEVEVIPFDLRAMFDSVVEIFACQASAQQLDYYLCVDPACPQFVQGDPGRIRQVLTNFLSNAFKFTSKGAISVSVTYDASLLTVSVADTGIGISSAGQAKLFQRFSQADSSTTRRFGGTGLGLAISKKLTELMGGSVWLNSQEGQGSTVYFSLPLQQPIPLKMAAERMTLVLITQDAVILAEVRRYAASLQYQLIVLDDVSQLLQLREQLSHQLFQNQPASQIRVMIDARRSFDFDKFANDNRQMFSELEHAVSGFIVAPGTQFELAAWPHEPVMLEMPLRLIKWYEALIDPEAAGSETVSAVNQIKPNGLANRQILIVDDNPVNQMVALGFVKRLGLLARCVDSGEKALALLQSDPQAFDCILMDCEMPQLDGFATTQRIRALEQSKNIATPVPIIALTAHVGQEHEAKCLAAGMNLFLSKPLVLEELERRLVGLITQTPAESVAASAKKS